MKKGKRKDVYLLVILIAVLFIIDYSWLDSQLIKFLGEVEHGIVNRVIDGDTVEINGSSVRLLGINSPERGEQYYAEAKEFMEKETLNKSVGIKYGRDKKDKYGRTLAYLYKDGENINLRLVEEGLANYYFPSEKARHYPDFAEAWQRCLKKNINLCEKSREVCAKCIKLKHFNHQEQEVVFKNQCSFNCDLTGWRIKDEGRKKFIFPDFILNAGKEIKIVVGGGKDTPQTLFWIGKNYVWTDTGDTLFLRDSAGRLVFWESYGK